MNVRYGFTRHTASDIPSVDMGDDPLMPKNIRFREDQVNAINKIVALDPESDFSKVIRRIVDEFLTITRISEHEENYKITRKRVVFDIRQPDEKASQGSGLSDKTKTSSGGLRAKSRRTTAARKHGSKP